MLDITPRLMVLGFVVETVIVPGSPPPLAVLGSDGLESNGEAVLAPDIPKATTAPSSDAQKVTVMTSDESASCALAHHSSTWLAEAKTCAL